MTPYERLRFATILPAGGMALYVRDAIATVVAPKSSIARSRRAARTFRTEFLSHIFLEADGHRVETQLAMPDQPPKAMVLLCHGIGEQLYFWREVQHILCSAGIASLIFHYPGYGRSTGLFTWENVAAGAHAAYRYLHELEPSAPMYVFGTSLGTAVAAHIASELQPAPNGVILSQGFTTLREAAKAVLRTVHLPTALHALVPDVWRNTAAVARARCPILVVHGASDQLFPVAMGEELHRSAEARLDCSQTLLTPKDFDHSDPMLGEKVEVYWQPILEFIRANERGRLRPR